MNTKIIRMPIDISMTVLSVILMGGTVLFPDDRVHQVLGMVLLGLWIVHTILNRRWYGSLFRGHYNGYRIMQTVINIGISVCAILLMVSGMSMAWFMPVGIGLGAARIIHLVSSHWYYIFMSAHLGMHISQIASRMRQKPAGSRLAKTDSDMPTAADKNMPAKTDSDIQTVSRSSQPKMTWRIIGYICLAAICCYGIYAFIIRGVWKYMFCLQQFFFLDIDRGYLLFAIDYLSILILTAAVSHCLCKLLKLKLLE